jgi:hypothetical protein
MLTDGRHYFKVEPYPDEEYRAEEYLLLMSAHQVSLIPKYTFTTPTHFWVYSPLSGKTKQSARLFRQK